MDQSDEHVVPASPAKVDLHRHLEGSIRPSTAVVMGKRLGVFPDSMTVDEFCWRAVIDQPIDLLAALDRFDLLRSPVRGYSAVSRIAEEAIVDAASDGVVHVDLRFSPVTLARSSELSMAEVFRAVDEGVHRALDVLPDVHVELLAIISRRRGVDAAWEVVRELETSSGERVDGVDFASDELRHRTAEFFSVANTLDLLGLPLTIHTGEGVDASAIAEALRLPGLRRLGHALSLTTDQALVDEVIERRIVVEVCPTSNLRSNTVTSYEEHPARAMLEAGVRVVICTDDPALFAIDLSHELHIAQTHLGFTTEDITRSQRWGREAFFVRAK